jgi:hypothetical protein
VGGAVGEGDGLFGAEEETGFGVIGAEVFVVVEGSEGGGVVGEGEDGARDALLCFAVQYEGRVFAEVMEGAEDGGRTEGNQEARDAADLFRGAVWVEGSVDEEGFGHRSAPGTRLAGGIIDGRLTGPDLPAVRGCSRCWTGRRLWQRSSCGLVF